MQAIHARTKKLARLLVDACEGKNPTELKEVVSAFVQMLEELGLLFRVRDIEQAIHGVWKERYGISLIEITTPYPVTQTLRQHIETAGKGAECRFRTDPALLGGAIVRIDDELIDGSIAGQLQRLKQQLL